MNLPQTVAEALDLAHRTLLAQTATPRLEAQLLLMNASRRPRSWILAHGEAQLESAAAEHFMRALRRVEQGEALPHVLGWWEFFGRRFFLSKHVLIPRPETELLVDHALRVLAERGGRGWVLDLGTGCGCIGVTLAAENPGARLLATDLSQQALRVAQINVNRYQVAHQVHLMQADLLQALKGPFDLVCANLPYIPSGRLAELEVADREPSLALDGGDDGLATIGRALHGLPRVLSAGGTALFEIETSQGEAARRLAKEALAGSSVEVIADLSGQDRLLVIRPEGGASGSS